MNIGIGVFLAWAIVVVLVGIGWIMNIIDLMGMSNVLSTGKGILRIVGIFLPPLGAVMGWFF